MRKIVTIEADKNEELIGVIDTASAIRTCQKIFVKNVSGKIELTLVNYDGSTKVVQF